MSRERRNFSAKFKSVLVIELLKGEKDLNTLATENNIQSNLLGNWKKELLNNASTVFDGNFRFYHNFIATFNFIHPFLLFVRLIFTLHLKNCIVSPYPPLYKL
ncbi:MAG: transposase [Lachnospiraceae bacterium]